MLTVRWKWYLSWKGCLTVVVPAGENWIHAHSCCSTRFILVARSVILSLFSKNFSGCRVVYLPYYLLKVIWNSVQVWLIGITSATVGVNCIVFWHNSLKFYGKWLLPLNSNGSGFARGGRCICIIISIFVYFIAE